MPMTDQPIPAETFDEQKRILAQLSEQEISDRIAAFRQIDIRSLNDFELARAILRIMAEQVGDLQRAVLVRRFHRIPAGTRLMRARLAIDKSIPLSCAKIEDDAWAPKPEFVKYPGRLNAAQEPLMYVCVGDPYVALAEVRAELLRPAAVFWYQARRDIIGPVLGEPIDDGRFSSEELRKLNLFEDFLFEEFTRRVENGEEHLYRASQLIAKLWYNLPEMDAWFYPSVQARSKLNVALIPEKAKDCLELRGALIGSLRADKEFFLAGVAALQDGHFVYDGMGSDLQRKAFPEIP